MRGYRLSSTIGGHGCGSEDRERFGTDKERKGHGLEKVEESLWMPMSYNASVELF